MTAYDIEAGMSSNARAWTSKIEFRNMLDKNDIDRECCESHKHMIYIANHRCLPKILLDHNKMTPNAWEDFCDSINEALKPLNRKESCVSCFSGVGFFVLVIVVVQVSLELNDYFRWNVLLLFLGITIPSCVLSSCLLYSMYERALNKARDRIADICGQFSDAHRDLNFDFYPVDGVEVKNWYITVNMTVRDSDNLSVVATPLEECAVTDETTSGNAAPVLPDRSSPTSITRDDPRESTPTNPNSIATEKERAAVVCAQVLEYLGNHDPSKVDRIDIIMKKFRGKEQLLLEQLEQKCKPNTTNNATAKGHSTLGCRTTGNSASEICEARRKRRHDKCKRKFQASKHRPAT